MNTNTNNMMNCKTCRTHLPELLLDETYAAKHAALPAHLAACSECASELAALRSTMNVLDEWTAPEISPYFDSKLHARLREAVQAEPEGLWERTRSFLLFSTGRTLRPALAGALAFAMLIGGGSFTLLLQHPAASATVNDLKILDNNAQAIQQMDQLLDESPAADEGAPPTT